MSGTQLLRELVNERLAAAANEIFGLVENTIMEYQDEVVRSQREIITLRQQLSALLPDTSVYKEDPQEDSKVFPSLQQNSNLEQTPVKLDQEIQVPPQIKEEELEEDLCINPVLEAGTSNSAATGLTQSEAPADCQLFPSCSAVTVSVNDDTEDDWNRSEDLGSTPSFTEAQLTEEMFSPKHDWSPILEEQEVQQPLLPQVKEEVEELGILHGLEGGPSVNRNTEGEQLDPKCCFLSSDCSSANIGKDEGWEASGQTEPSLTPSSQSHTAPSHGDSVSAGHLGSRNETTDCHCVVCGREFESRGSLTDHLQTHTDMRFCHICCSCFGRDIDLVRHVDEIHPGEKPFKCHVCSKVFGRREHLTMHSRIHTGEKPYQCPFCDKSFTQSAYLCVHKRTHTGEKPYCCSVCGKRFYTSSALKNCMKYHTGDRSFHCQYCGKAFYTNTHLQVHIRVHTGSKPFHCPVCYKHFAHQTTVKNHMKTHNNKTQMKQRRIPTQMTENCI